MTTQLIVDPSRIEQELLQIWEALAKENKTRACLFNLIIFSSLSSRTDYFRTIVQTVIEKFPCRVLFISADPESSTSYLKTAVSVISSGSIACDNIDIGVAGDDWKKVPFLLLPHLVPDLPVYLLWGEDPGKKHPLFAPLSQLATRVIFDSESTNDLKQFAHSLLSFKGKEVADLNWARTEGWRDLLISLFAVADLGRANRLVITYNCHTTPFFGHTRIQALYVAYWLASRLQWKFRVDFQLVDWLEVGPGNLVALEFATEQGIFVQCKRLPKEPQRVQVHIETREKCDLPYQFVLGKAMSGQSLAKEVTSQGTSPHYLETLRAIDAAILG